ncbi:MAG: acylglycerol kinase family protein [Clostridia bacterium]|nr:acylglycerol kinase family protein [Clostridia bacterium]
MKHVFIVNPCAGKGKNQASNYIIPRIKEYFEKNGGNYEIHETTEPYEGIDFVKYYPVDEETVRFYACGGDGTLFEVVNGAYGKENVEVAVIPLGSGNDFIRLFGNKEDLVDVEAQVNGTPIKLDVIKCLGKIAINSAQWVLMPKFAPVRQSSRKFRLSTVRLHIPHHFSILLSVR